MVRIGNYYPYSSYKGSHISVPHYSRIPGHSSGTVKGNHMAKVRDIYVGSRHVYPENLRYTLKYRNRLDFTFHGNNYGFMFSVGRYAEAITVGYIEDTVRLNTAQPTFIQAVLMDAPEDYYVWNSTDNKPILARNELYRDYSGVEFLITPACALYGASPLWKGEGKTETIFSRQLYRKYTKDNVPLSYPPHMGDYSIIMERTVHSHTVHPVYRNWYFPEEYSTDYTIRARFTRIPCPCSKYMTNGYYINCSTYANEMKVTNGNNDDLQFINLGFAYREASAPGGECLVMFTDMGCRNTPNCVLLGAPSPPLYGYLVPGTLSPSTNLGYTLTAPMFTGHKRIECHEDGIEQWSYTVLDGTFQVLENNNPVFATIEDYVKPYAATQYGTNW